MSNLDLLETNELNKNAAGGSELMLRRIYDGTIPRELLKKFQIIPSRVRELDPDKVRILLLNDLPGDPESDHLKNGGWSKFNLLVFVSNWQADAYISHYNIPPSKTIVMLNAINPIESHEKPKDKIRLAYWSTPHRGLEILVPVFEDLVKRYENIELHTYASFGLYGWEERDQPYKPLFDRMDEHPAIFRHPTTSNMQLREELKNYHILAFPSIWKESSCLVLQEAMSAKMLCVHPNLAALWETAANWTSSYQFNEDLNKHAQIFHSILGQSIEHYWNPNIQSQLNSQKAYADVFYNWTARAQQWTMLLESLQNESTEIIEQKQMYSYTVG
jgi:UDP-glucose:(glucosyl)LPS alpha-1,2-glucosyltransferase